MKTKSFEEAVEKVYKQLVTMDDQDFANILENNRNGDYAKVIYATNPLPAPSIDFGFIPTAPIEYNVLPVDKDFVTYSFFQRESGTYSHGVSSYVVGFAGEKAYISAADNYDYNVMPSEEDVPWAA